MPNADSGRVIAYVNCPVCCGYRRKIRHVRSDLLVLVRAEYKAHLISHLVPLNGRSAS